MSLSRHGCLNQDLEACRVQSRAKERRQGSGELSRPRPIYTDLTRSQKRQIQESPKWPSNYYQQLQSWESTAP